MLPISLLPPPSASHRTARATLWGHERAASALAHTLSNGALQDLYAHLLLAPDDEARLAVPLAEAAKALHRVAVALGLPLQHGVPLGDAVRSFAHSTCPTLAVAVSDRRAAPLPLPGEACLYRAVTGLLVRAAADGAEAVAVAAYGFSSEASQVTVSGLPGPEHTSGNALDAFVACGGLVHWDDRAHAVVLTLVWGDAAPMSYG